MSEALTDLREAVHLLTHPQTRLLWQGSGHDHGWVAVVDRKTRDRTGDYQCEWCDRTTQTPDSPPPGTKVVKQVDEPLLDQLAAAVVSSIGPGGAGKSGDRRLPLDVGALQLCGSIDERVRAWLEELGARPGSKVSLRELLSSWLVLFVAGRHEDATVENYRQVVAGWEAAIRDTLTPRKRLELTFPCTVCNQEFINVGLTDDPNDIEMVRALNVVEGDTLDESYAMCKACKTVWMGVGRMRDLRIAHDDRERARETA